MFSIYLSRDKYIVIMCVAIVSFMLCRLETIENDRTVQTERHFTSKDNRPLYRR